MRRAPLDLYAIIDAGSSGGATATTSTKVGGMRAGCAYFDGAP